jgi:hypothetical protein
MSMNIWQLERSTTESTLPSQWVVSMQTLFPGELLGSDWAYCLVDPDGATYPLCFASDAVRGWAIQYISDSYVLSVPEDPNQDLQVGGKKRLYPATELSKFDVADRITLPVPAAWLGYWLPKLNLTEIESAWKAESQIERQKTLDYQAKNDRQLQQTIECVSAFERLKQDWDMAQMSPVGTKSMMPWAYKSHPQLPKPAATCWRYISCCHLPRVANNTSKKPSAVAFRIYAGLLCSRGDRNPLVSIECKYLGTPSIDWCERGIVSSHNGRIQPKHFSPTQRDCDAPTWIDALYWCENYGKKVLNDEFFWQNWEIIVANTSIDWRS